MYLADAFSNDGRDLFADLNRLLEAVDRSRPATATANAGLDLWANEDALHVTLDAPGLDPASIDLAVLGDTLTIRATTATVDQQRTWLRRERPVGSLTRTVHLPYAVDGEKAEARYSDGVLAITLHRHAGSKPQRIAVQAA